MFSLLFAQKDFVNLSSRLGTLFDLHWLSELTQPNSPLQRWPRPHPEADAFSLVVLDHSSSLKPSSCAQALPASSASKVLPSLHLALICIISSDGTSRKSTQIPQSDQMPLFSGSRALVTHTMLSAHFPSISNFLFPELLHGSGWELSQRGLSLPHCRAQYTLSSITKPRNLGNGLCSMLHSHSYPQRFSFT